MIAVLLLCALCMLSAGAGLWRARPRLGSPLFPAQKRRYSGLITWLLMITVPTLSWMIVVAPYAVCYSSPVVLVIGIALWLLVSFTMSVAALSDPGVIPRCVLGPAPDDTVRQTTLVNGVEIELKICATCGIVRPPRASHDRKTDRCVNKFDHFCVFIGNSVGRSNYPWFLCFVGLTSLSAIYLFAYCLFHVVHLADRLEREGGSRSEMAFSKAIGQAIGSVVIGLYFAVMGTLVTLLFVLHCYLVSTGQTTAEFMKGSWKKGRNPFDRGMRSNWLDMLCAASRDGASSKRRNKCDIQPSSTPELAMAEARSGASATGPGVGEYVGPKIYSPREGSVSVQAADVNLVAVTAPGRVTSAEFQVHIGDQVVSTTLSEKMLKKSLHKALIDPFLKHNKSTAGAAKIDKVVVDGVLADVSQPASAFVKHTDRAVSVQLLRPGDPILGANPHGNVPDRVPSQWA